MLRVRPLDGSRDAASRADNRLLAARAWETRPPSARRYRSVRTTGLRQDASTASLRPARERPARRVYGEWMPEGYRDAIAAPPSLLDAGAVAY